MSKQAGHRKNYQKQIKECEERYQKRERNEFFGAWGAREVRNTELEALKKIYRNNVRLLKHDSRAQ